MSFWPYGPFAIGYLKSPRPFNEDDLKDSLMRSYGPLAIGYLKSPISFNEDDLKDSLCLFGHMVFKSLLAL